MSDQAPWAADLEAAFADEDVRTQVDGFMREKYQPYVTGLEQKVADLEPAQEYYTDLTADPGGTWVSLTHEILGDELAQKVLAALQDDAPADPPEDGEEPPAQQSGLSKEDSEFIAKLRERDARDEYNEAVNAYCDETDAEGNKLRPDLKADWFHPFVAAAGGNLNVAYGGYKEWLTDVKAGLAPATAESAEEAAEDNGAPPTLGSQTGGAVPPGLPTEKDYKGDLGAAISDMFKEMNKAPSTVGST